jgi:hypothetical protein
MSSAQFEMEYRWLFPISDWIMTLVVSFRYPTRMGTPIPMLKLPVLLCQPQFATVIGMAFYAHRTRLLKTH